MMAWLGLITIGIFVFGGTPNHAAGQRVPTPTMTPTLIPASSRQVITRDNASQIVKLAEIAIHPGLMRAVAFSPDGSRIAVGGQNGTITLIETDSGTLVMQFMAYSQPVDQVAFTPDARRLIIAGWDKTIRIWDISQQAEYLIASLPSDTRIFDIAMGADLFATAHGDGSVHVWTLTDYTETVVCQTPANAAYSVAFSPDQSELAVGTDTGLIEVFNTETGEKRQTITSPVRWVQGVTFTAQGDVLGTDVLQLQTLPEQFADQPEGRLESLDPLRLSPQEDWLLLSSDFGLVLWSFPEGEELAKIFDYFSDLGIDAALSPDGTIIAVTTSRGIIQLWGIP